MGMIRDVLLFSGTTKLVCYILLAILLIGGHCLPSVRQCLRNTNNSDIAAQCDANKKHVITYMPPKESIYFSLNNSLQPPTHQIPERYFPLSIMDVHRDARFYKDLAIPNRNRRLMLIKIFKEFLAFAKKYQLKWWLVHGGLIGRLIWLQDWLLVYYWCE